MLVIVNERDIPGEDSYDNLLDQSHSIVWRVFHGTSYLFGGLLFICGSCMYFTNVIANNSWALEAGAWLFIIGSVCFLVADLQDWLYYRISLFFARKSRQTNSAVRDNTHVRKEQNSFFNRCRQVRIELNYLTSITGSVLYVIGSIFFLPKYSDSVIVGDALFIAGSAVIYLSEGWKIHRLACTNVLDSNDTRFRYRNIISNLQAIFISIFAGFGGVFYFIGTILFLPQYNTTDFSENRSGGLFLCGGVSFSLAGLLLQYRYYCTNGK